MLFSKASLQLLDNLSEREITLIQAKSEGLDDRQAGKRVSLSEDTLSYHFGKINGKLGLKGRREIGDKVARMVAMAACRDMLVGHRVPDIKLLPPLNQAKEFVVLMARGYSYPQMKKFIPGSDITSLKSWALRTYNRYAPFSSIHTKPHMVAFAIVNRLIV